MNTAIVRSILEMQSLTRKADMIVGFVPTMGYLHEGHLSLVEKAKEQCDLVIVSIFVNPSQFAPGEDLQSYPRDIQRDFDLLSEREVDYIFYPSNEEMYPQGYSSWVNVQGVSEVLCGKSRPTHFRGVSTIVLKLVNIANPNYMYMGEKDYQQVAVLQRMLADFNLETVIVPCAIIREKDGLAMSSRNKYLSNSERKSALCLYQSIEYARSQYRSGRRDTQKMLFEIRELIESAGGKIDYAEFRNQESLAKAETLDHNTRLFLAVYFGKTRLIDNSLLA